MPQLKAHAAIPTMQKPLISTSVNEMSVFKDRAETVKARIEEYENLLKLTAGSNDMTVYLGDGYFATLPPAEAEAFLQRRLVTFRMELEALNEFQGLNEDGLPIMDIVEELDSNNEVVRSRVERAGSAFQELLKQPDLVSMAEDGKTLGINGAVRDKSVPSQSGVSAADHTTQNGSVDDTKELDVTPEKSQTKSSEHNSRLMHDGTPRILEFDSSTEASHPLSDVKERTSSAENNNIKPVTAAKEKDGVIELYSNEKHPSGADSHATKDESSTQNSSTSGQVETPSDTSVETKDLTKKEESKDVKPQISPEDVLELELFNDEIGELDANENEDETELSYDFKNLDISSSEEGEEDEEDYEEEANSNSDSENDYGWRGGSLFPGDDRTQKLLRESLSNQKKSRDPVAEITERQEENKPTQDIGDEDLRSNEKTEPTKKVDEEEPAKSSPSKPAKRGVRFSGNVDVHEFETNVSERKGVVPLPKKVSQFKQRRMQTQKKQAMGANSAASTSASASASAAAAAVAAASSPRNGDRRSQPSHGQDQMHGSSPRRAQPNHGQDHMIARSSPQRPQPNSGQGHISMSSPQRGQPTSGQDHLAASSPRNVQPHNDQDHMARSSLRKAQPNNDQDHMARSSLRKAQSTQGHVIEPSSQGIQPNHGQNQMISPSPQRAHSEPYSRRYKVPAEKPLAEKLDVPREAQNSNPPPAEFRETGIVRDEDMLEKGTQKYINQSFIPDEDFIKLHDNDEDKVTEVTDEASHEKPLLDEVHERSTSQSVDDEYSRDMRAIRLRHQQLRQKMVYESGGYRKTDKEQELEPIEEPKRKISRFKAARR